MDATRVGVIGCGAVSGMYLPILARSPYVDVVAFSDVSAEQAQARATEFGIDRVISQDELLADPSIEIVCNLTPIPVHFEVSMAALRAGKHVYSEKSLATSLADAQALVAEAASRGLALGCAPDTLLGTGFQISRKALYDGIVGHPLSTNGFMFRSELAQPTGYSKGANPFFDMGPYYLSALINLFGPVRQVSGATRTDQYGVGGASGAPIAIAGTLEFADGLMGQLVLGWGTAHRGEIPVLTVYGTEGILHVPNPNNFGDPGFAQRYGESEQTELPGSRQPEDWPRNLRGLGVAELALAVREGRAPRTSGDIACHVVDIVAGLVQSAATGGHVKLTTTCEPAPELSTAICQELVG